MGCTSCGLTIGEGVCVRVQANAASPAHTAKALALVRHSWGSTAQLGADNPCLPCLERFAGAGAAAGCSLATVEVQLPVEVQLRVGQAGVWCVLPYAVHTKQGTAPG
jgi:hypothetical protein